MNEYNKGYDEGFQQGLAASEFTDGYWLRCYAGQAMQGILASCIDQEASWPDEHRTSEYTLKYATALLEEVKKHG